MVLIENHQGHDWPGHLKLYLSHISSIGAFEFGNLTQRKFLLDYVPLPNDSLNNIIKLWNYLRFVPLDRLYQALDNTLVSIYNLIKFF